MSFPTPTSNGELYTINGYTYQWFAGQSIWKIVSKSSTISNATINNATINVSSFAGEATFNANVFVNSSVITVGNTSVNVSINSTSFSGTSNNSSYLGGNSVSTILTYANNKAANAYSNAVTYADLAASNAYSNSVTYTNNKAANAYSNAVTYADFAAANAYSNAIAYSGNAAQAYSNATTYTDNKAANAYSNAIAYSGNAALAYANAIAYSGNSVQAYTNAVNYAANAAANAYSNAIAYSGNAALAYANAIAYSGNAALAYANAISYTNTNIALLSGSTFIGNVTFNANIIANTIVANGSHGTVGQVLTANSTGGLYWASDQAVGNVTANIVTSNTLSANHVVVNNDLSVVNGAYGNAAMYSDHIFIGNGDIQSTINSTTFWATYSNTTSHDVYISSITYSGGFDSNGNIGINLEPLISLGMSSRQENGGGGAPYFFPQGSPYAISQNLFNVNASFIQLGNSTNYVNFTVGNNTPLIQFISPSANGGGITINQSGISSGNSSSRIDANTQGFYINGTEIYTRKTGTTFSGNVVINANLTVNSNLIINKVVANGSLGNTGQVLTANSTGGLYWTSDTGLVNVTASVITTNTLSANHITINNDLSVVNGTYSNVSMFSDLIFFGNNQVNATINSTAYTGFSYSSNTAYTANNASYLNGNTAATLINYAANAYSNAIAYSGNAAQAYSNAISFTNTNIALLTGAIFSGNVTVNSNLTVTGNIVLAGSTTYINSTVITTTDKNIILANGAANSFYTGGAGIVVGNTANIVYNDDTKSWQSNVSITPYTNNLSLGASTKLWNLYANQIIANGSMGTAGQILTSNGTSTYWTPDNSSTAYSNAIAYSGNAALAYANAIAYSGNAALAYANAIAYSGNAALAYANAIAYTNTNIALKTGTTFTGNVIVNANLVVNTVVANGLLGTTGQVLTANSTGGLYWATDQAVGNITATIITSNTLNANHVVVNNDLSVVNGTFSNVSMYSDRIFIGNSSVNTTINSTSFTGTANNTLFVGTVAAANVVSNAQLSGNLANYTSSFQLSSNLANYAALAGAAFTGSVSHSNNILINSNTGNYFLVGNTTSNIVINSTSIAINGSVGTTGQVLTSNGTVTSWTSPSAGSVNTASQYTFTNVITHTANLVVNGAIIAGGNSGTVGQVLTSNGTGNVYWSSPGAATVNTAAQYSFTNTITFSNAVTFSNTVTFTNFSNAVSSSFTANGSQTTFTLGTAVRNQNNSIVTLDGMVQVPTTHYSISGVTLTMTSAPIANSIVEVRNFDNIIAGGGGGVSTGKAIAMAIVFGG